MATVSLPVRGRVAAVRGGSAGANRAAALCQRLAGRRTRTSAVPTVPSSAQLLICPALQMADFNLRLVAAESCRCPYCSTAHRPLQDLNGGASLCQDVLDGAHVPAELRRQYKERLSASKLPPSTTTKVGLESEVSPPAGGQSLPEARPAHCLPHIRVRRSLMDDRVPLSRGEEGVTSPFLSVIRVNCFFLALGQKQQSSVPCC